MRILRDEGLNSPRLVLQDAAQDCRGGAIKRLLRRDGTEAIPEQGGHPCAEFLSVFCFFFGGIYRLAIHNTWHP